ncbi:hypothetical protein Mgrana_00417 [Meiothermus granaticius NBRC 107808]|uniref:Uncharacterized protein n=1 Tax=Meiothermus granaticius NBRC 107808 TaxID=1227551 RepID=A0A399FBR3_9DEIN|nr:hypothetical protein Mgrana_00417 [Meiothermus granaticius NBRC 107808]
MMWIQVRVHAFGLKAAIGTCEDAPVPGTSFNG